MRRFIFGIIVTTIVSGCTRPTTVPLPSPVSGGPSDRHGAFAQAIRLIESERYADAATRFHSLETTYPELADYHLYYRGLALARSGHAMDAAIPLRRVLSEHPRSVHRAAAALELGRVQSQLGQHQAARGVLQIASDANETAIAYQADLELARLDVSLGDVVGAATRLQRVRQFTPRTEVGIAARTELERLRARHPEIVPSGPKQIEEAGILIAEQEYAAAEALARSVLAQASPADRDEVLHLHASALLGLGRIDDALIDLRAAAGSELGAEAAATDFRIASILWNHDRDAEALTAFATLRRRFPRAPKATEALYAIARIHEKADRTKAAIAAYHQLAMTAPHDRLARESQWRIAWIHYRNGNWPAAAQSFGALAQCRGADDCADGIYWQARAFERQGRAIAARERYRRILDEAPLSYYAMWAEQRLGVRAAAPIAVDPPPPLAVPTADGDYHLLRAAELKESGLESYARVELAAHEREHFDDRAALLRLLTWYRVVGGDGAALRLARRLGSGAGLSPGEREHVMYPLGFWPLIQEATRGVAFDPLLVAALIRQESLYDPEARSPADAYGLMQLLPVTAQRVAGGPVTLEELRDPQRNIALGTRYLAQLFNRFGGDELKAIAAYNGGDAAVEKWQRRFGGGERDEFVESISYRETRDYVKKVIGGYRRYQMLYGAASVK